MKIKVTSFLWKTEFKDTAQLLLEFRDDENTPFLLWYGKYSKKGNTYQITDYMNKEMFFNSLIDWNDISEEVENALLAFDHKYNIDIK